MGTGKSKKLLALFLVLLMTASVFAGCAKQEAAAEPAAAEETAASTEPAAENAVSDKPYAGQTVNVLLDSHPWQKAVEPLIASFTEKTGIEVNVTVLGEDVYWDRVNLGLSSSEPPFDVFMLSPNQSGYTGYTNGWIASLDEFINDPVKTPAEYQYDDIYPYIVDGFRFPDANGEVYGIPLTMETYMLFYRKDIMAEQNIDVSTLKTMDDWMAALDQIDAAYKDQGIAAAVIRGQDPTMPDELLAAVYNNWGNRPYLAQKMFYFDENWNTQFTDPAVVEGFKTWAKLVSLGPTGSTSFTWYDCSTQFAAGNAATYWFDASVFASIFEDPTQSQVVGKVGYLAVPPTATGNGTTHWAWGLAITENSKVKDAAWQFVQWSTSPEVEQATAKNTYGPVRASTWKTMASVFGDEFSTAVDTSLNMSAPGYMYFNGSSEICGRIIDAVIRISQGEDANTVMQWLDNEAKTIVENEGLKTQP
ncbi:MAG TPA: extracellular solute-binding protein [Candidatus Cryosericum sp.]|nr:extracellular solute-binding protein [Candidatus Cryosericum sp.]